MCGLGSSKHSVSKRVEKGGNGAEKGGKRTKKGAKRAPKRAKNTKNNHKITKSNQKQPQNNLKTTTEKVICAPSTTPYTCGMRMAGLTKRRKKRLLVSASSLTDARLVHFVASVWTAAKIARSSAGIFSADDVMLLKMAWQLAWSDCELMFSSSVSKSLEELLFTMLPLAGRTSVPLAVTESDPKPESTGATFGSASAAHISLTASCSVRWR